MSHQMLFALPSLSDAMTLPMGGAFPAQEPAGFSTATSDLPATFQHSPAGLANYQSMIEGHFGALAPVLLAGATHAATTPTRTVSATEKSLRQAAQRRHHGG